MPAQTLSRGRPPSDRYGLGGYANREMRPSLASCFSIFVGPPNSGKSFVLQDHPECFIFNVDLSSTTHPAPRASIWPGVNPEGIPVESPGDTPITLDYETLIKKVDALCNLPTSAPRPKTVAFDSLSMLTALVQDFIVRSHERESWKDLDGRMAWEYMGDLIMKMANRLRRAGYGVIFVAHMVHKMVPIGENLHQSKWMVQINDNLFRKLFPAAEFIPVFESNWVAESHTTTQTIRTTRGVQEVPKTTTRRILKFNVTTRAPDYDGFAKPRRALPPTIEMPREHPWDHLEQVYNTTETLGTENASVPEE